MSTNDQSKLDSKKCILAAAAKLFARLGLDKCSTREIAKESQSNISLISYYFGGKEGLYKEVIREHLLEVKSRIQEVLDQCSSSSLTKEVFVSQLSQMVELMVWFRQQNPEVAKIMAREKLTGMSHCKEIHSEIFLPIAEKSFEIFRRGQQLGFVRENIHPAVFFVTLSEGVFSFFQMMECDHELSLQCRPLLDDQKLFVQQILNIYLMGVLK